MLRNKDTTILSEINGFFTTSEKAIVSIFRILQSTQLTEKIFYKKDACNVKYRSVDKLTLLLLFPFFEIKDASAFGGSALYKIISCGKDVFYRMLNDSSMDWRSICYALNIKLLKTTAVNSQPQETKGNRCLIIDDTDLHKTGRHIEFLGRIFSHVTRTSILGFKGLIMAYHDGKSLFALDASLHCEKGQNKKKPYGLTPTQAKERFSKKRAKESIAKKRTQECFTTKIESMISMIRLAISKGIRFDYLLVDSWFTCFELVQFIKTRKIGCHLLGMIKMGTSKYSFNGNSLSAKQIVDFHKRKKQLKRSRNLGYSYIECIVDFQGIKVKLFFCKTSHKGKWHGLLTTNLDLSFEQAYKIYSTRWSIEVFFKESKQHLGLGKCQSQDFDAQIASVTISMLQYNILSVAKRFSEYETLGELFRSANAEIIELTITERIWLIIKEIISQLADLLDIDTEVLMGKIITDNHRFEKLLNYKNLMQAV
jgi:DDE superfamily endonuclease